MKELRHPHRGNMQGNNTLSSFSNRGNNEVNNIVKYDQNVQNVQEPKETCSENHFLSSEKRIIKYLNEKIFETYQAKKSENEKKKEEKKAREARDAREAREAVVNQENGEVENSERYEITPSKRQRTRKLWTRAFQKVTSQRLQGTLSLETQNDDKCCDNNDIEMTNTEEHSQTLPQSCDDTVSYAGGRYRIFHSYLLLTNVHKTKITPDTNSRCNIEERL